MLRTCVPLSVSSRTPPYQRSGSSSGPYDGGVRGVEDYLQQIKRLEEGGPRCTATVLPHTLGGSPPSASEMLKRLAEEGSLERAQDGAIHLTAHGRPLAHMVLRRHRLVERLLTDMLGMPWHEVHREAQDRKSVV